MCRCKIYSNETITVQQYYVKAITEKSPELKVMQNIVESKMAVKNDKMAITSFLRYLASQNWCLNCGHVNSRWLPRCLPK